MHERYITGFMAAYDEVFTEDGKVQSCGRDKCKNLIEIAAKCEPDGDFGNAATGCMNIKALHMLHSSIKGLY